MKNKICLITGANSGIGKAAALRFARAGANVILACRNESRGKAAIEEIKKHTANPSLDLLTVDLSSMKSIAEFQKALEQKISHLDVLVHNAANFDHSSKHAVFTEEGFETIFATNYLGPFLMTNVLTPLLSTNARIITIGTKGLDYYLFTDLDINDLNMKNKRFTVAKAYYNSKLAHLMYSRELAERSKPITVNGIRVTNVKLSNDRLSHLPWYYRSAYAIKSRFSISTDEMAKTYEYLAFSDEMIGKTGLYYDERQKVVLMPKKVENMDLRHQLWDKTENMLKPWLMT
jgi:NAD(P)-dependent dehydrogenase (short-subunit alcohol dehydrogenase family)